MRAASWSLALISILTMAGCGGSEYRFGNQRRLPSLTGDWIITASSQTMSQQFQGTGNFSQANLGLQGTVNLLFDYCAPTSTLGGSLTPTDPFDSNSVTAYSVSATVQENVVGGQQAINLLGSASADGNSMSGTYTASAGTCTTGDSGVWSASKGDLNSAVPNLTGNWEFTSNSTPFAYDVTGNVSLQQSGNVLSGQTTLSGTPCASAASLTGLASGTQFAIQLNENGQAVNLVGTVDSSGTAASGNYNAAQSGCTNGDYGTWTAKKQP